MSKELKVNMASTSDSDTEWAIAAAKEIANSLGKQIRERDFPLIVDSEVIQRHYRERSKDD